MSALNLLLGTRRLRREINLQAQQLQRDIEHEQYARVQLQQTVVNRVTSPLGLLSAVAAGFVAGKIGGRPAHANRAAHAVASAITFAMAAARSIGMQVVIPMAAEWFQSKFTNYKSQVGSVSKCENDNSDAAPANHE